MISNTGGKYTGHWFPLTRSELYQIYTHVFGQTSLQIHYCQQRPTKRFMDIILWNYETQSNTTLENIHNKLLSIFP